MTARQVNLLKTSFEKILLNREQVAELFYNRLFLLNPSFRNMFKNNMKEQGQKLILTLEYVVSNFKPLPSGEYPLEQSLRNSLMKLGNDHKAIYGVKSAHYHKLEDTLLWTLEVVLGTDFTREVKLSWVTAYAEIAKWMMKGEINEIACVATSKPTFLIPI